MGRRGSSDVIQGHLIKELLKIKGMTITDLSDNIGYARSGVSTSINKNKMDTMMLDAIAQHLDCSVNYLKGLEAPTKPLYGSALLTQWDTLDSQGRIIPHYNAKMENRLAVLRDYLTLLGQRGVEDIDAGVVRNWTRADVMKKCDAIFEFRLAQRILVFLKDEGFLKELTPIEVNIPEGDE